jgi:hypoxanthine phosphoribosyltransferase
MRNIILSEDEIRSICKLLGQQLSTRYRFNEKPPVFIGVMKGALPFLMDLIKEVDIPIIIDFVQLKSYNGTESTGTVSLKKDVSVNLKDRDVIIVEDIVDSGISMVFLVDYLKKKYQPNSIVTVSLLDKKINRKAPFELDYAGKEVGEGFLMGYGLDYNELYRNAKYVFIPDQEEINSWDEILKK